jgi:hypothetical protein
MKTKYGGGFLCGNFARHLSRIWAGTGNLPPAAGQALAAGSLAVVLTLDQLRGTIWGRV